MLRRVLAEVVLTMTGLESRASRVFGVCLPVCPGGQWCTVGMDICVQNGDVLPSIPVSCSVSIVLFPGARDSVCWRHYDGLS